MLCRKTEIFLMIKIRNFSLQTVFDIYNACAYSYTSFFRWNFDHLSGDLDLALTQYVPFLKEKLGSKVNSSHVYVPDGGKKIKI